MKKNYLIGCLVMAITLCGCGGADKVQSNKEKDTASGVSKSAISMEKIGEGENGSPFYRTEENVANVNMTEYSECKALGDRQPYPTLESVEGSADMIVKANVISCEGQVIQTEYDWTFERQEPTAGVTQWKVEITKAYKGKLKAGQQVIVNQEYYLWTAKSGEKQLIKMGDQPMLQEGDEVLLFLGKEKQVGGYMTWANENALYTKPSVETMKNIDTVKLTQENMNIERNDENYDWKVHQKVYREVMKKYYPEMLK